MNFTGMRDVRAKLRVLFSLCSKVYIFNLRDLFMYGSFSVCLLQVGCVLGVEGIFGSPEQLRQFQSLMNCILIRKLTHGSS